MNARVLTKCLLGAVMAALGVGTLGLVAYNRAPEPACYGLTATEWVKEYSLNPRKRVSLRHHTEETTRHFTNRLGHLLHVTGKDTNGGSLVAWVTTLPNGDLVSGTNIVGRRPPIDLGNSAIPKAPLRPSVRPVTTTPRTANPALIAIKRLGPEAVPYLARALEHQEGMFDRWQQAAWQHSPPLVQSNVLSRPFPALQLRRNAAALLEELGDGARPAIPSLLRALDDPDRTVRLAAIRILARQGEHARAAVPALIKALAETDIALREAAFVALDRLPLDSTEARSVLNHWPLTDATAPRLLALIQQSDLKGQLSFRLLERLLESDDYRLRLIALCELEYGGPERVHALPRLIELVNCADASIAMQAMEVICTLGPAGKAALPAVEAVQATPYSWLDRAKRFTLRTLQTTDTPAK